MRTGQVGKEEGRQPGEAGLVEVAKRAKRPRARCRRFDESAGAFLNLSSKVDEGRLHREVDFIPKIIV
jgi:hypothetical protein